MIGTGAFPAIPGLWRQPPGNPAFHPSFQRCWSTSLPWTLRILSGISAGCFRRSQTPRGKNAAKGVKFVPDRVTLEPQKPCTKCARTLGLEQYPTDSRSPNGRAAACLECGGSTGHRSQARQLTNPRETAPQGKRGRQRRPGGRPRPGRSRRHVRGPSPRSPTAGASKCCQWNSSTGTATSPQGGRQHVRTASAR